MLALTHTLDMDEYLDLNQVDQGYSNKTNEK